MISMKDNIKLQDIEIKNPKLLFRWLNHAYNASNNSENLKNKVGSSVVEDDDIETSGGWNGLCRGIRNSGSTSYRNRNPYKDFYYEHSERNAIYNAARSGRKLRKNTIYCTHFPCSACTRGIIQTDMNRIITPLYTLMERYHLDNYDLAHSIVQLFETKKEILLINKEFNENTSKYTYIFHTLNIENYVIEINGIKSTINHNIIDLIPHIVHITAGNKFISYYEFNKDNNERQDNIMNNVNKMIKSITIEEIISFNNKLEILLSEFILDNNMLNNN